MKLHYFSLSITNLLLTTPIIKDNWGQLLLLFLPPANLTCLIRQLLHNISHSDITLFAKNIIWSVILLQKIEKTQKLTHFFYYFASWKTSCSNISFLAVHCLHALKEHSHNYSTEIITIQILNLEP